MSKNNIYVLGGGTVNHVRPHLALSAPAYGQTARDIASLIKAMQDITKIGFPDLRAHVGKDTALFLEESKVITLLTRMADSESRMETNRDVALKVQEIVNDTHAKVVFMSAALCDFEGSIFDQGQSTASGKGQPRLSSSSAHTLELFPADKIIGDIRRVRKDIFLVGFKTTAGATVEEQFAAGLKLLKTNSCNLVLANDVHTRVNMIITPEEVPYEITQSRATALSTLVNMTMRRADLTFTRSKVVESPLVQWSSDLVPSALRTVVNHCIEKDAYKPFLGKTVGHFAFRGPNESIITSVRKSNFNELDSTGMVKIETVSKDNVIAYGARPSVGGQSQRIIFTEHPEMDSIVHFHCPVRSSKKHLVPTVQQFPYECGSHECGKNTSQGLRVIDYKGAWFKVVYLEGHGPNIVFSKDQNPQAIMDYIDSTFDLSVSTGQSALDAYTRSMAAE